MNVFETPTFEAPGERSSFDLLYLWSKPAERVIEHLLDAYAKHFEYDVIAVDVLVDGALALARDAADRWLAQNLCADCELAFRQDDASAFCEACDMRHHKDCTDDGSECTWDGAY